MTRTLRVFCCFSVLGAAIPELAGCVAEEADVPCSDIPMPDRVALQTVCVPPEAGPPPRPTVTFPTWSSEHDQTQTVQVVPPPRWTIDRVEYSVEGGPWLPAPSSGGNGYSITLTDLDVGSTDLILRVDSSFRGTTETNYYHSTIADVAPVFDCDPARMLPSATLLRDQGTEVRTLLGYFGDPAGGHTVSFVLRFSDINNNEFDVAGTVVSYGRDSVTVEFDVGRASCDTGMPNNPHDCDVSYSLRAIFDGEELCRRDSFGVIHDYWER